MEQTSKTLFPSAFCPLPSALFLESYFLPRLNDSATQMMNNSQSYIQKSLIVLSVLILAVAIFTPSALAAPSSTCPQNMVFIPGGEFKMGSDQPEFIEELPVEDITVSSFCIDSHEMTNAQFAQFVEDTGYVTIAERPLSKEQFPDLSDEKRSPGSLVFEPPTAGIQQVAYMSWWHWVVGLTG